MYEKLISKNKTIGVIGLGYVGLPLAISFAKKYSVIGFDLSEKKIENLINGIDVTGEVVQSDLENTTMKFTSNPEELKPASFYIVAVPTPITEEQIPDLSILRSASVTVGEVISKGDYVVFESTVYPGVTEEICKPIIEEISSLKAGVDFNIGYSPERINPGDKIHRLETITKVVSGDTTLSLQNISKVYNEIIEAGVYEAPSIKVAEAAKVIENSQRDINIAFMNELSMIFDRLNIDTYDVLKAAGTKWNFLNFSPGLVGGHCIGVDPYYLTYKAKEVGYDSQIILSGRRLNDSMGKYIAEKTVKLLIDASVDLKLAKVGVLGFTFKENCPDIRNTRVIDIIDELREYKIECIVNDPFADKEEIVQEYGIELTSMDKFHDLDALIVAVSHDEYKNMGSQINSLISKDGIIIDVKGILDDSKNDTKIRYWSL